jgi:hypothetical protein
VKVKSDNLPINIIATFYRNYYREIYISVEGNRQSSDQKRGSCKIGSHGPHELKPQTWRYEISKIIDDPIGQATYTLTPESGAVTLVCKQDQRGYEVQQGNSYWSSIDFAGTRTIRWQRETYAPISDVGEHTLRTLIWTQEDNFITVETTYPGMETKISREPLSLLAQDVLVTAKGIWLWQLAALSFEAGAVSRLVHLSPDVWRPASGDNGPVLETMLVKISMPEDI